MRRSNRWYNTINSAAELDTKACAWARLNTIPSIYEWRNFGVGACYGT